MKPNLFALATKELSQDAFITWLLQWADADCHEHNPALNAVAVAFVKRLIMLQSSPPSQVTRVVAERQWRNIDVCAEVNDSHLIVIEDKVGSGQHSDQLARYRKIGEDWCQENGCELVCVYIKTRSDSSANLADVTAQGFAVFSRPELLELLNVHEVTSDIYNDFRDRLRELEDNESQFTGKAIGTWSWDDWTGFYKLVERVRPIHKWEPVNNPNGGFLALILNWLNRGDYGLYMQIEQGKLCFKVGDVYEDQSAVRSEFHSFLMNAGGAEIGLGRPHFGTGAYMTVAFVPRSVWLGGDDEIVDPGAVIERLNRYESWLIDVIAGEEVIPQVPI